MLAGIIELAMKLLSCLAVGGMGFVGGLMVSKADCFKVYTYPRVVFFLPLVVINTFVSAGVVFADSCVARVLRAISGPKVFDRIITSIPVYVVKNIGAVSVMIHKHKPMNLADLVINGGLKAPVVNMGAPSSLADDHADGRSNLIDKRLCLVGRVV